MSVFHSKPTVFNHRFKVSVVGAAGNVGATGAYAMLLNGIATDLVLIDIFKDKVDGVKMDFMHSSALVPAVNVSASDDFAAAEGSNLVVITAGARQKEGETRLQLIETNRKIFGDLIPKLVKAAPEAIFLIVSNPVDVLTYEAIKLAGLPKGRVFGSGTVLDTARFRFHLSEKVGVHASSINAYILGEHGDSSFPVISSAEIGGQPLLTFPGLEQADIEGAYQEARDAAYKIIKAMGFTCYSIGTVIAEIAKAIRNNSAMVLPVSVELDNYHGHSGVALSVPTIVDASGASKVLNISLNDQEKAKLAFSVETLKAMIKA